MREIVCPTCGRKFVPGRFNGVHHGLKFCSRECGLKGRARAGGRPPGLACDPDSRRCRQKALARQRAERERLMVALTQWDYICKAASPIRVTVARVGRAVVESRGKIPIHNSKKWAMA
ncbi:MAG: hypothetical protein IIZ06_07440 [Kiritimatiellae bacterium]|nr:hypothetical protein [Kiritimatiellia bacterium]